MAGRKPRYQVEYIHRDDHEQKYVRDWRHPKSSLYAALCLANEIVNPRTSKFWCGHRSKSDKARVVDLKTGKKWEVANQ